MTSKPGIIAQPAGKHNYALAGYAYDGSTNFATRNPLAGAVASKKQLISLWFKVSGGAGTIRRLFFRDPNRVSVSLSSADGMTVGLIDAGGGFVVARTFGAGLVVPRPAYYHFIFSTDAAVASSARMYLDDALVDSSTPINGTPDSSAAGDWDIGATVAGANKFTGCIADLFYNQSYLDLSVTSNRRKFITADLQPVDLGADGSGPLGAPPLVYVRGRPSINAGTGGNYTENGVFAPC